MDYRVQTEYTNDSKTINFKIAIDPEAQIQYGLRPIEEFSLRASTATCYYNDENDLRENVEINGSKMVLDCVTDHEIIDVVDWFDDLMTGDQFRAWKDYADNGSGY